MNSMKRIGTVFLIVIVSIAGYAGYAASPAEDIVFEDFEKNTYEGWQITGSAFGESPAKGTLPNQNPVRGFEGNGLVNSFYRGDNSVGSLLSKEFTISHDYIAFKIGGGDHKNEACIELWVDLEMVRSTPGNNDETLEWNSWNVKDLKGKQARIRILDAKKGGWGHINIDQITFTDTERKPAASLTLEEYRNSDDYYREEWRPGIHFTPEINWMNDPNGMVYYDGEFHLFYQFNPFGKKWGHMSWGHAVSKDMFHWEHLPVALYEEDNVMIFSGSAVIDWKNTTGFKTRDEHHPPMVAVYTGHYTDVENGLQNQHIAYSLDRGRTWTKYQGNPVLDRSMADFRDPKVIWHEPSGKWIMTICLPLEKKVAFYASPDLKNWTWLSEFGPAGAVDGIWECPDLFPLKDQNGDEYWVLIVNLNPGSYAGGSGGQYFIGQFDGKIFRSMTSVKDPLWLDYGRDYYATVTWADVPESDGRRLSIGWMSNWLYANDLPVSPWRSAMSLPRQWSVQKNGRQLILKQILPREFIGLRHAGKSMKFGSLKKANQFLDDTRDLLTAPFEATMTLLARGSETPLGIEFMASKKNRTKSILSIDPSAKSISFDRNDSGNTGFHPNFPTETSFPLRGNARRVQVRAVVDTSSIEIFLNDGNQTITSRVFPSDVFDPLTLFGDEEVRVSDLQIWKLKRSMGTLK